MPQELKEICDRFKTVRLQGSFSQEDFARVTGMSQSVISAYEKHQRMPTLAAVIRIAQTCNVSPNWLVLGEKDDMPKTKKDMKKSILIADLELLSEKELEAIAQVVKVMKEGKE